MDDNLIKLNMIQLRKAVVMASLPAERQIGSFPSCADVPYEVADDFSNWCRWVLGSRYVNLSQEQRSSLESLKALLGQMSGEENAELWTEDALRYRPEWDEVRRKAQRILASFGWDNDK